MTHVDLRCLDTLTATQQRKKTKGLTARHFAHGGRGWLHLRRVASVAKEIAESRGFGVVEERNGAPVTPQGTAMGGLGPDLPFQVPRLQVPLRGDPACASFCRLTCL